MVLFVALLLLPLCYALYLSVHGQRLEGSGAFARPARAFVGLINYTAALRDPALAAGMGRALLCGAVTVPTTVGLALLFALLIDSPAARGRRLSRTAIFMPYAVPGVIATLLWGFLYLPSTSPLGYLSHRLGDAPIDVLSYPTIYLAVANITVWANVGFNMIILYTALRAIPGEVYEAARLDGAGELDLAVRIKIPLLRQALVLSTLFGVIGALQLYSEPTTLRQITPSISTTWVPLMEVYQAAFARNDLGYASAVSVLLVLATLLVSLGLLRLVVARSSGDLS